MVETMGLEPTTPCLQSRCSSQLSYVPVRSFAARVAALAVVVDVVLQYGEAR